MMIRRAAQSVERDHFYTSQGLTGNLAPWPLPLQSAHASTRDSSPHRVELCCDHSCRLYCCVGTTHLAYLPQSITLCPSQTWACERRRARPGLSSASRSRTGSEPTHPCRTLTNLRLAVGRRTHTSFAQRGTDLYALVIVFKDSSSGVRCQPVDERAAVFRAFLLFPGEPTIRYITGGVPSGGSAGNKAGQLPCA